MISMCRCAAIDDGAATFIACLMGARCGDAGGAHALGRSTTAGYRRARRMARALMRCDAGMPIARLSIGPGAVTSRRRRRATRSIRTSPAPPRAGSPAADAAGRRGQAYQSPMALPLRGRDDDDCLSSREDGHGYSCHAFSLFRYARMMARARRAGRDVRAFATLYLAEAGAIIACLA